MPSRGADLRYDLKISLEEAFAGRVADIKVSDGPKERALRVSIPPGIEDGIRIRLAGQGEAGPPPGDLYIFVSIKPHEFFQRDGADLHCRVPIPVSTAVDGGTIKVPGIDSEILEIKIPEATQSGTRFRLELKGMPILRSKETGDLYVQVLVDQVWISEVMSNNELGNKVGIRHKWFGEPWEAPYVNYRVPETSERVFAAVCKHYAGHTMMREDMPEASAVYSMPHFRRAKDIFFAGAFLAVKGRVAEVLSKFDFGAGGGLVPHTIYEADEKTPLPGPFYIINFGPMKDCFLPDASTNIGKPSVHHETGQTRWYVTYVNDGDVAVSPAALAGSDLWMCPGVEGRIFMSNRVVEALKTALSDADFAELRLRRCRVVG
jgi:hypothetical protein